MNVSNEATEPETGSISDTGSAATSPDDAIVRPRRAGAALTCAVGLVALGSLGYFNPGNFVWVETLFDHVFVFGVIAALLAGWAHSV